MIILFNTDRTIIGGEKLEDFFSGQISNDLERFKSHITRIEVYLKDENGKKEGVNDIKCVMSARLEGRQPIAVTSQADNNELAVSSAIDKLTAALDTILGRMQNI